MEKEIYSKAKRLVLVVTRRGVEQIVNTWLDEGLNCELYVSKNARGERCVEVIHDGRGGDLGKLLKAAQKETIAII